MQFRTAKEIVEDTSKGASELFFEAGTSILQLDRNEAEQYAIRLVKNRYSMAPLVNLANVTFNALDKEDHKDFIDRYISRVRRSKKDVLKKAREELDHFEKIGTLSYSSTVLKILSDKQDVSVLESRPLLEGRKTAEILSHEGVHVEFYPDNALFDMISEVDVFVTGCDSLSVDHFTNKTGTHTAVIVCEHLSKPVYLVSDISKVLPKGIPSNHDEKHDPEEVWDTDINVNIHNTYFEKIPFYDHITLVNSEEIKRKDQYERVSDQVLKYHPRV
ncbi:MAG: hypothetical protein ACOCTK_01625 [Candidatus Saliniplasma sp.]